MNFDVPKVHKIPQKFHCSRKMGQRLRWMMVWKMIMNPGDTMTNCAKKGFDAQQNGEQREEEDRGMHTTNIAHRFLQM